MENLLFSDVPQNDTKVMKSMKVTRIVLIIFCVIVLLFAVLGLILKDIVIVIDSVIGIVLFSSLFITCLCMEQQYLLVFTDKIKYKKGLSGKEKQLTIAPSQYKIKLRRLTTRGGYTVWMLFYNQKGKRVLSYKLCQPLTDKRKYDLSQIGCEIIDRQKAIKQ